MCAAIKWMSLYNGLKNVLWINCTIFLHKLSLWLIIIKPMVLQISGIGQSYWLSAIIIGIENSRDTTSTLSHQPLLSYLIMISPASKAQECQMVFVFLPESSLDSNHPLGDLSITVSVSGYGREFSIVLYGRGWHNMDSTVWGFTPLYTIKGENFIV